jgi:hypothetical protein
MAGSFVMPPLYGGRNAMWPEHGSYELPSLSSPREGKVIGKLA